MRSDNQSSRRTHGRRSWRHLSAALAFVLALTGGFAARAETLPTIVFDDPPYPVGTIHNKDGWSSSGSAGAGGPGYDHAVAAVNAQVQPIAPQFGGQALRISNAVTSGSFGDHTFSKSLANEAGEPSAVSNGMSGGTRQSHFEAEWEFISTTPAAPQPGLSVVASPDRGDGARMSWVQMTDTGTGIDINFNDYQRSLPGTDNFVQRPIATGLPRNVAHKIKITMDFFEGPENDIVRVFVNGTQMIAGTSWEDYFRDVELNPTRPVDSVLFRTGGTAVPATATNGFYIDNLVISSSASAAMSAVFVRTDGHDLQCDGSTDAAASADGKCAFKTIARGYSVVASGGTVNVGAGPFAEAITLTGKPVTISGAGTGQTVMNGGGTLTKGFSSSTPESNVTIQDLTIQNYTEDGIHLLTGPLNNIKIEDVELLTNGRHGLWSQAFGIDGFILNRVNASSNNAAGARGVWFINGAKKNITVTNSTFNGNRVVGLDLADGTLENAVITDNQIQNNGDSGMGVLGAKTSLSVKNNTLTNNGRFGIEIKNPDGLTTGTPTLVVEQNTVTRNQVAADGPGRDYAGIAVFRRDPVTTGSALQPAGVLIQNNVVSGYQRKPASNSDGFGIVVAGTNIQVKNNILDGNDVGIQIQAGNPAADNSAVTGTEWFDRDSASSYSGVVQQNDIRTTNSIGLRAVNISAMSNATLNWWGSASGPTHAANAGGTGSSVVGSNVDYSPWLGDGTDTSAAIGFQPNLTPLFALATDGINVAPTTGLVTTENGGTAQFAIVLASQPTANVTVPLSSSNTNEGTVNPTSLTFTPANWNVPQTVTVTGVALAPNNGNVAYTIVTGLATSADPSFNGLTVADVSVTNNASAVAAINVAPTSGLVTTENGGTAQFGVVLAAVPTGNVTVPLSSSNTNEGTVNPTSLTFTPQNWNTPQTVTVTGVALAPGNGNVAYTIVTGAATSTDPAYNGLNPADVSVTNSAAAVPSVSIADATVAESPSGSATLTFNVTLSQAAPSTVTVSYATQDQSATSGANGDFVAAIGIVSFAPGETTKPINVTVVTDTNTEQPETLLVNLSSPSGATISRGQATGTIQDTPLATLSCAPRPDFAVQTQSIGSRQMLVTINAGTSGANNGNVLRTIQFRAPTNATIQMTGQTSIGTGAITLPTDTRRISFTVTQTDASAPFLVPYTITDNCGAVEKFAGGGKDAVAN